jgi:hypothetical protein
MEDLRTKLKPTALVVASNGRFKNQTEADDTGRRVKWKI